MKQAKIVFFFTCIASIVFPQFSMAADQKWSITCVKKVCEMFSEIRTKDNKTQARIFIQQPPKAKKSETKKGKSKNPKPFLIAMLPLGIHIPTGVTVAINNKNTLRAVLLDCTAKAGCRAAFDITDKIKGQLDKGKQLSFLVIDSQNKRQISFNFSLNKFSGVYKKFQKQISAL